MKTDNRQDTLSAHTGFYSVQKSVVAAPNSYHNVDALDALDALDVLQKTSHYLSARALYRMEVARLPRLTPEEEQELALHARLGDKTASHQLIIDCLRYTLRVAYVFHLIYRPKHVEMLDLVQHASAEMVAKLDKALAASNPPAYLRGIAERSIERYLMHQAPFIPVPASTRAHYKAKGTPIYNPIVESLDTSPKSNNSMVFKIESIVSVQTTGEEMNKKGRYAPLYTMVYQMTPRQQNFLAKRFGLGQLNPNMPIGKMSHHELASLRRKLAPYLDQMMRRRKE